MELPAPYISANNYITLPITTVPTLPKTIEFEGVTYFAKDEFHVSLVHTPSPETVELFRAFVVEHPITLEAFLPDIRHAVEGDKQTLVIRCRMTNLDAFFTLLEEKQDVALPHQPEHVTLYRNVPDFVGIGITAPETMESYEKVTVPEVEKAFTQA